MVRRWFEMAYSIERCSGKMDRSAFKLKNVPHP